MPWAERADDAPEHGSVKAGQRRRLRVVLAVVASGVLAFAASVGLLAGTITVLSLKSTDAPDVLFARVFFLTTLAVCWPIFYMGRRFWRHALLTLLIAGFAWFVWPTPYRDLPGRFAGDGHINRFTGAICLIGKSCW